MTPEQRSQLVDERPSETSEGGVGAPSPEAGPVETELLIEDVSIDGMCGVY